MKRLGFLGNGSRNDSDIEAARKEFDRFFKETMDVENFLALRDLLPAARVLTDEELMTASTTCSRLLTEDPRQRLGANGALEVKQHPFFKDISWDTLAWQKAAFVPSSDSAFDTSHFTSRCSWNLSDETTYKTYEFEDSSDNKNRSCSCASKRQDGTGDYCGALNEFESDSDVDYHFRNSSFKVSDLTLLQNLSQLASINYDLLTKGLKDGPAKHTYQSK
nr:unnamed protein product [Digitaria exilis]CAB3498463.1 unnamed protein product [Digitaria exilis]